MEDDPLEKIIKLQEQIAALRRGAEAFPDPLQAIYLKIADVVEQFAREYDRAATCSDITP